MVPNQISASTAIPMLQQLGSKAVRLWYSVGNWSDRSINSWDLSMVQQYNNAGYTVTLAINNPNVPDYNTAKGLYSTLANSQLKNYVDYWEVGNEPNMYEFWHGSLQQFVTNNMRPAYEALHAVGEKVIGVHRRGPLAPFSRRTFSAWWRGTHRPVELPTDADPARTVVYFHGCAVNGFEPDLGREAVGMSVGIPKRQVDRPQGPKDDLDRLVDDLDSLGL